MLVERQPQVRVHPERPRRWSCTNVEVACARAEEWQDGAGACDVVTARALASLPVLYEYAAPLLREGGVLVAWKGAVATRRGRATARRPRRCSASRRSRPARRSPFAGSERRTLHVARKIAPTPAALPAASRDGDETPAVCENLR